MADGVGAIGVTEATHYRWRAEYSGLKLDHVKRLTVLEQENGRMRHEVGNRAELRLASHCYKRG